MLVQSTDEVSDFVELEDRYNYKEIKMVLTTGEIVEWLWLQHLNMTIQGLLKTKKKGEFSLIGSLYLLIARIYEM